MRGFEQKQGIDYQQTFAGTFKSATWKVLIALAALYGLEIHQIDGVTAFLQGKIDGEVYVELPP